MTADERVSILYYEICCTLLHRWNFDRSNVKADMNEMCRQCGATYDELRSILKHLRTKYLQPFRDSVRSGEFQGDFFSYYCSIKRPRGRPPAGTLSFPSSSFSSPSQPGAAAGGIIASSNFNMPRHSFNPNPAGRAPRPARMPSAAGEVGCYPSSSYSRSHQSGYGYEGVDGSSSYGHPSWEQQQRLGRQRDASTSVSQYQSGEDLDEEDDHVQFTFASGAHSQEAHRSQAHHREAYARDVGVGTSSMGGGGSTKTARRRSSKSGGGGRGSKNVVVKRGRSVSASGSYGEGSDEEDGPAALLHLTQGSHSQCFKRTRPVSPPHLDDCELLMGLKVADSRLPATSATSGTSGGGKGGPIGMRGEDAGQSSPRSVSSTATRIDIRHMSSSPLHASTKTLAYDPTDSPAFIASSSSHNPRGTADVGRQDGHYFSPPGPSNGYMYDPRGGYVAAGSTPINGSNGNGSGPYRQPTYPLHTHQPQQSQAQSQGGYTLGSTSSSHNNGRGHFAAYTNTSRSVGTGSGNGNGNGSGYAFPPQGPNGYTNGYINGPGHVNMEERSVASLLLDMSHKIAPPCAL